MGPISVFCVPPSIVVAEVSRGEELAHLAPPPPPMDDIEFTPPDTPNQYPSQNSLLVSSAAFFVDGGPMNRTGTPPSKDGSGSDGDSSGPADGHHGVSDGAAPVMPQPDGGVLAALGPPTSSQGSASSSAPKHATRSVIGGLEDDLTSKGHENDDDADTPRM